MLNLSKGVYMVLRLMLATLIFILGCSSQQKEMSEMSPEYRFHVKNMKTARIKGHKLRYIDQGEGDLFFLIHGIPTNSWMYRKIIKDLAKTYRVIAPDLIGFGQSSKPSKGLSVKEHGEVLSAFLSEKIKVKTFNLMVHDFGGPIGFSMLGESDYEITQAVILDTFFFEEGWKNGYNFFSKTVNAVLPKVMTGMFFEMGIKSMFHSKMPSVVIEGYVRPLTAKHGSEGYSCLYKSIPDVKKNTLPNIQKTLKAKLNANNTKVVWGDSDPFLDSKKQVDQIAKSVGLSRKNILILKNGKHLVADENAEAILNFIKE